MSRQISQRIEADRLTKRVRVVLHRDTFIRLCLLADYEVTSRSEMGARLLEAGMTMQVTLDRLARIAPALATIDTFSAQPEECDAERLKVALNQTQFRRLCNLAHREFEPLVTMGGRLIEMGISRYRW